MNIPNNYKMSYNTYFCDKDNNSNKKNKCQEHNVQTPLKQNHSPSFGGVLIDLMIADYLTDGAIFGRPSYPPPKTTNKKNSAPTKIKTSKMDLRMLESKLLFTDIKVEDNRVTIKNDCYSGKKEQIADIPKEFFKNCKTDKDKEFLVKRWLVESKYDYNIENIPYELLKAADDVHFYQVDNHRMYMDYDTQLRNEDIKIGKFEKASKYGENNIINIEVDGKKYRFPTSAKKTEIILGAASYVGAPFKNYPFADIIKNIKDTTRGKFVKENDYEVFIPKLYLGEPTLKNKTLINHGTDHDNEYNSWYAKKIITEEIGTDVNESNLKQIDYIKDHSSKKRFHAYSYYDDAKDEQYLYLMDEGKIMKEDCSGNVYQKNITNYEKKPWEKVEK